MADGRRGVWRWGRLAATALVAALTACGGGGGGGGGSSSAGASAGSPGTGFTGNDTTAPVLAVDPASGPGAMLTGPGPVVVRGTISDAESGPDQVTVNGIAATLNGAQWEAQVPLAPGTAYLEVVGRDRAGNETRFGYSVIRADVLLDPSQPVGDAAKVRLTANGFAALSRAASVVFNSASFAQNQVGRQVQFSLFGQVHAATVRQASYGAATLSLAPDASGLRAAVSIPRPRVVADVSGFGNGIAVEADRADVDATVFVDLPPGGGYSAVVQTVSVRLTNPRSNHPLLSLAIQLQLIEAAVEDLVRRELPGAVTRGLQQVFAARSYQVLGTTLTASIEPSALRYAPDAFEAVFTANLTSGATATVSQPGGAPAGSFSRRISTGSSLPVLARDTHDVYLWLSEDAIDRALYAAWEAGLLDLTVDQAFLQQLGLPSLPLNVFDARILALFFPPLAAILPPSGPVPIALRLRAGLPPTLLLQPAAAGVGFDAAVGELRLALAMDLGGGYTDVLALDMHAGFGASAALANGALQLQLGSALQLHYRVNNNPFGFNPPDISQFINTLAPQLTNLLNAVIPPLPIPGLPAVGGVQPHNLELRSDGPGGDYLNLRADL